MQTADASPKCAHGWPLGMDCSECRKCTFEIDPVKQAQWMDRVERHIRAIFIFTFVTAAVEFIALMMLVAK